MCLIIFYNIILYCVGSAINEIIKRRVIEQWLSGETRDKIAADLQIGAGTVSAIVTDFKKNLQGSDIDSVRELALEAKKQGFTLSDLAPHIRLHNFFIKSGASENEIETFITNVHLSNIPSEKVIEYLNQLYEVSKEESIPLDQVSVHIREKLEEKKKIESELREADAMLQNKNVNIETLNEHIRLNEKLNEYNLSFRDIDKLLNVLINAKENGFDPKLIVRKLSSIRRLEKKQERLKNSCEILSKQLTKYKEIIPLAELVHSMNISGRELMSFKAAVNETAQTYGLTPSSAALDVINLIIDHSKKGQLKRELSDLSFQKYAIDRFCSSHSQVIMALINLKNHGITEEQIILLNNFLESNGYKASSYTVQPHAAPRIRNFGVA